MQFADFAGGFDVMFFEFVPAVLRHILERGRPHNRDAHLVAMFEQDRVEQPVVIFRCAERFNQLMRGRERRTLELKAEINQRVQAGIALQVDTAATAAVAAVRPALFDELFPPERDAASAAIAGAHVDLGLVEELHAACSFMLR